MADKVLPPLILELRAKASEVHAELKKVGSEVEELDRKVEGGATRQQKAFSGLASAGKAIGFGLVGAAGAIGAFGIEATETAQVADAKLDTAVKNVGGSMEELKPQIDATDAHLRNFGFTNADTNTALASLTTALGDPRKALADMSVAADLARQKNIPLAQSALLVAKAAEGQTRPLKALGIDLPVLAGGAKAVALAQQAVAAETQKAKTFLAAHSDAVNKSSKYHLTYEQMLDKVRAAQSRLSLTQHAGTAIMTALTARVHGQAAAFGDTLKGKIAAAHAQLDNLGEKVGSFLIPKLLDLANMVQSVVAWFGKHTTVAKVLAGVVGGVLAAAIGAYIAVTAKAAVESAINFGRMIVQGEEFAATQEDGFAKTLAGMISWTAEHAVMAAGFIAENVAMAASATAAFIAENAASLGLVAAIAAIVAAVVWLVTHWSTAWNGIKAVAMAVWNDGLRPVFTGFMAIVHAVWDDAIRPVFGFIGEHWGLLFALMTGGLSLLIQHWRDVWDAVKTVYSDVIRPVFSAIGDAFDFIVSAGRSAWDGLNHYVILPISAGFSWLVNAITTAKNDVSGVFSSFFDALKTAGATVFNWVATAWNDTVGELNFNIPSWVPGIGGDSFGVPKIPTISGYATGGNVMDGLVMFGEHGAELGVKDGNSLTMLNANRTQSTLAAGGGLSSGARGSSDSGWATVPVQVILDGDVIAAKMERLALQRGARRGVTYQGYRR